MLEKAVQICGAKFGMLFLSEGDSFRPSPCMMSRASLPRSVAASRWYTPLREAPWAASCGRGR